MLLTMIPNQRKRRWIVDLVRYVKTYLRFQLNIDTRLFPLRAEPQWPPLTVCCTIVGKCRRKFVVLARHILLA